MSCKVNGAYFGAEFFHVPTSLYIQASRLAARRGSPWGIAGSPTDGNEIRLLAQLDPDFKTTLKPFIRKWFIR